MITENTNHIGILYVRLFIPSSQSLKNKRMVIKRLKERIRLKHNVSVAELDGHDKWQSTVLGVSMIGRDQAYIDGALQKILSFIDSYHAVEVCDHQIQFC